MRTLSIRALVKRSVKCAICRLIPYDDFLLFNLQMASEDLIQAAALGDEAKVDAIIKAGAVHVDVVDKLGHSALLAAAVRLSLHVDSIGPLPKINIFTTIHQFTSFRAFSIIIVILWYLLRNLI